MNYYEDDYCFRLYENASDNLICLYITWGDILCKSQETKLEGIISLYCFVEILAVC